MTTADIIILIAASLGVLATIVWVLWINALNRWQQSDDEREAEEAGAVEGTPMPPEAP